MFVAGVGAREPADRRNRVDGGLGPQRRRRPPRLPACPRGRPPLGRAFDGRGHLGGGLEAVFGHLRHRLQNERLERRRKTGVGQHLPEQGRGRFPLHENELADVVRLKRFTSRQDLEKQDPHGIKVGARVNRARGARLLRRHVARRPHGHPGRHGRSVAELRQAEVENAKVLVEARLVAEDEIFGLEIAVNNPLRVRHAPDRKAVAE